MAKSGYLETDALCRSLVKDAENGIFKPVYLLMGEEPYYPEMVCDAVLKHCIPDYDKDFNEIVCYGSDVDADAVITAARRFPMMAERQLVVVKEAQQMNGIEEIAAYCEKPLESTVLVLLLHGGKVDKRKALYKMVQKVGVVVSSEILRDYEMPGWINSYFAGRGLQISPDASALLAESVGMDLARIAVETDKMMKNLPEGTTNITASDIEKNIGISRQYSIFELTKCLSEKNRPKALKIATYISIQPKFAMPAVTGALFLHFNRIVRYASLLVDGGYPDKGRKAKALAGANPYFYAEYDTAVRNYPLRKAMAAVSLICDYDYRGKGGDGGELATQSELMVELITKILNL
ncbi:MAG: DNA polymerase III subunit delta [Bacteroidales bacterium]|nr:DNA polymerase III subunit delta [Bacteroidales bacterium]